MDGRMKDPLSETLERVLRVDPSPEFLARVRRQVATAPAQQPWIGWKVGFVSAGIAAVLATVGWITATRMEPNEPAFVAVAPVLASREVAPAVVENLVEAHDANLTRHRPPARAGHPAVSVLIPRSELVAFRRWIRRAQSESFGFSFVPEAVPVNQELSVPEITLMPIGPSDSLE